jgi:hypothetical protein
MGPHAPVRFWTPDGAARGRKNGGYDIAGAGMERIDFEHIRLDEAPAAYKNSSDIAA